MYVRSMYVCMYVPEHVGQDTSSSSSSSRPRSYLPTYLPTEMDIPIDFYGLVLGGCVRACQPEALYGAKSILDEVRSKELKPDLVCR